MYIPVDNGITTGQIDLVTGGKEIWWILNLMKFPVFVKVLLFRNTQFNNMWELG
jgi:hypothetical protein